MKTGFHLGLIYCVLFLCVSGPDASAQKVTFSPAVDLSGDRAYEVIGELGNKVLVFIENKKDYHIQAFDLKMNKLWDRKLDIDPREYRVRGTVKGDRDFHIFLSQGGRDTSYLFHLVIDNEADIVEEYVIDSTSRRNRLGGYLFTMSEDKNQVVFLRTNRKNFMRAASYDVKQRKMNFVEEIVFSEDVDNDFKIMDITNNGEVLFILNRHNTRFRSKKHRLDIIYSTGTGNTLQYEIPYEDQLFTDLNAIYDNVNNKLKIAGFYSYKSYHDAEGYFTSSINLENGVHETVSEDWSMEILQDIHGRERDSDNVIKNLELEHIQLYQDGGMLLFCEKQRVYQRRNSFTNPTAYRNSISDYVDYYFEDVILISQPMNNSKSWSKVIHKRQFSQDDGAEYSSFFVFSVPSYIQIIFNDEISKNSIVSGFMINGNGRMKRTSVMSTDYQDLRLKVKDAFQVSNQRILIPSEFKSELRLVLVDYSG